MKTLKTFKAYLAKEKKELEANIASYAKELETQGYTARGAKNQAEHKFLTEFNKDLMTNGREIEENIAVEAFEWAVSQCIGCNYGDKEVIFKLNGYKIHIYKTGFKRASFTIDLDGSDFHFEGDFREWTKNAGATILETFKNETAEGEELDFPMDF